MSSADHVPGQTDVIFECELSLPDEDATLALGVFIAGQLQRGDVVTLRGDLGAGKTTLSRGILRALGHDGPVPSPTFTLVQHYETDRLGVAHFDLYRLASSEEIFELGFDEARHDGAVLVEWPEVMGSTISGDRLDVQFEDAGTGRMVQLAGYNDWASRLGMLSD